MLSRSEILTTPPLEIALEYASRGWRVFPVHSVREDGRCTCRKGAGCSTPGKHPRTRNGFKDASTDAKQIEEWWKRWPDANVAVRCGEASGVMVLDLDRHEGEADGVKQLQELERAVGVKLPQCPIAKTGGNGWHLFFRYAGATHKHPRWNGRTFDAIDVQSDGVFVVLPYSMHISGRRYAWQVAPDEIAIPEIPPEWLPLLLRVEYVTPATKPNPPDLDSKDVDQELQEFQEFQELQEDQELQEIFVSSKRINSLRAGDSALPHEKILEEIGNTVPTKRGQRHRRMFQFVRRLRFNLKLSDHKPAEFLPYVREWYRRAKPHIDPTVSLESECEHFLDCWKHAEHPDGGTLGLCIDAVNSGRVPASPDVEQWGSRALVRIDQLCRALHCESSGGEWFVPTNSEQVQVFLGIDPSKPNAASAQVSRYLGRLVVLERIEAIRKGSSQARRATTYRFIGTDQTEQEK